MMNICSIQQIMASVRTVFIIDMCIISVYYSIIENDITDITDLDQEALREEDTG